MEIAWLLGPHIGFVASLWQLALKGPPWLVLFYCPVQQALKGQPWLESFSIAWCIRGSKCHLNWVFSLLVSYWCQHVESERLQSRSSSGSRPRGPAESRDQQPRPLRRRDVGGGAEKAVPQSQPGRDARRREGGGLGEQQSPRGSGASEAPAPLGASFRARFLPA